MTIAGLPAWSVVCSAFALGFLLRKPRIGGPRRRAGGWLKRAASSGPNLAAVSPLPTPFDLLYHVPRSQCHPGSRGRQSGNIHLHVKRGEAFQAGRIRRVEHESLCGRRGWYEREVDATDSGECARCAEIGSRSNGFLSELITP